MKIDKKQIKQNFIKLLNDVKLNYVITKSNMEKFDKLIEEACDLSKSPITKLDDDQTLILRMRLGIFNNGKIQTYENISKNIGKSSERIRRIINRIYRIIYDYRIKKEAILNKKMSSFNLDKASDIQLSKSNLDIKIKNKLYKNGIYTISDLLSYGTLEFKKIGFDDILLKQLYYFIHGESLKLIEELNTNEKKQIILQSTEEEIYNSSLYFLDNLSDQMLTDAIKKSNFKIGELRKSVLLTPEIIQSAFNVGIKLNSNDNKISPKLIEKSIDDVFLSFRTYNCLHKANLKYIKDIIKLNSYELSKIQNLEKGSQEELIELIHNLGLFFEDEILTMENYSTKVRLRK